MTNKNELEKLRRQSRREKNRRRRERERRRKMRPQKKWYGKISLKSLFFAAVFIWAAYKATFRTINDNKLASNGEYSRGLIYATSRHQARFYRYYWYIIDGRSYKGYSLDDEKLGVGDSIDIVYLPSAPYISSSSTKINKMRGNRQKRKERGLERRQRRELRRQTQRQ